MRLLHSTSRTLRDFTDDQMTPEYVILSHTWEDDEVLYKDIIDSTGYTKKGWTKLQGFCEKAKDDGFEWVWMDTCCIDKESSAELSEAINSMFKWYKSARICYAYLADIASSEEGNFYASRWFTRGWTLQELIAPPVVEFYSNEWVELGTKVTLKDEISDKTGIPPHILLGKGLSHCRAAEKLSWASDRHTTRVEDRAYSLLGLFDVHMPMLYGEGTKAFTRLQQEILNQTMDYSVFAWYGSTSDIRTGILASSPGAFSRSKAQKNEDLREPELSGPDGKPNGFSKVRIEDYGSLIQVDPKSVKFQLGTDQIDHDPPMLTSRGLRMTELVSKSSFGARFLFLNLLYGGKCVCIMEKDCCRANPGSLYVCKATMLKSFKQETLYMNIRNTEPPSESFLHGNAHGLRKFRILYQNLQAGYEICVQSMYTGMDLPQNSGLYSGSNMFTHYFLGTGKVVGVIMFRIARNSYNAVVGDEPQYWKMTVVIGQGRFPWCVIYDYMKTPSDLKGLYNLYTQIGTENIQIDRDARYINTEHIVTVAFRNASGTHDGHTVTHQLSVRIHRSDNCPRWALSRTKDLMIRPFLKPTATATAKNIVAKDGSKMATADPVIRPSK